MKIPYLATHYAGCKYRSRTEARWAVFFDAVGIRFQYEESGFDLDAGAYLPDFWLPGLSMFFEVKGAEPTAEEREKCRELALRSGHVVLLGIGQPEERFQILWFDGDSDDDRLWVIARDPPFEVGLLACGGRRRPLARRRGRPRPARQVGADVLRRA